MGMGMGGSGWTDTGRAETGRTCLNRQLPKVWMFRFSFEAGIAGIARGTARARDLAEALRQERFRA